MLVIFVKFLVHIYSFSQSKMVISEAKVTEYTLWKQKSDTKESIIDKSQSKTNKTSVSVLVKSDEL